MKNGPDHEHPPLLRGRVLALAGIVLLAVNLRTAVGALSPIAGLISGDISLGDPALGAIGMLPPFAFAISAFAAGRARRLGPEKLVAIAMAAAVVGHAVRALSPSFPLLLLSSALVFLAMGIGNVALPPLVKKYFPDRIGVMTSLYTTVNAIGMALPPLVAYPLADRIGWRGSLGVWAIVAGLGLVPWMLLLIRGRASRAASAVSQGPPAGAHISIARSRTAWGLTVTFAVVSIHVYTMFAWLPELLVQRAGQTPYAAGALLALYSALGLPLGIVVPVLVERMAAPARLVAAGGVCLIAGYAGLIFLPGGAPWLWVILLRLGSVMFPLCLVMINLRSRTHAGSARLSTFVQGIGYTTAALGPLVVGAVHEMSDSWLAPLILLVATIVPVFAVPALLRRRAFVEDELRASRIRTQQTLEEKGKSR